MSSEAMKWAKAQTVEHGGLRHMLTILATSADQRGQTWRAQLTMAQEMGISERSVRRYLRALAVLGAIQRAHRSNGKGGRSSDLIHLRLDRPFTITRETARALLQPDNLAGSKRSSNRTIATVQPDNLAGDKLSDQLRVEIYQEEHPQDYQSAQRGKALSEKPPLRVVNGGRP